MVKFSLPGSNLKSMCECLDLVPHIAGIPCSERIRFDVSSDKVTAKLTSSLIAVASTEATVTSPGQFFLHRMNLIPWLTAAPTTKEIFFSVDGSDCEVRQGKHRKVSTQTMTSVSGYGSLRRIKHSVAVSSDVRRALVSAAAYAVPDPTIPKLHRVGMCQEGVFASDEISALWYRTSTTHKMAVPVMLAKLAGNASVTKLSFGKDACALSLASGVLVQMSLASSGADAFPWRALISRFRLKLPIAFSVKGKVLNPIMEQLERSFAPTLRREPVLSIVPDGANLRFSVAGPSAVFSETIKSVAVAENIPAVECRFNALRKAPILDSDIVLFRYSKDSPYMVIGKDWRLLLARRKES